MGNNMFYEPSILPQKSSIKLQQLNEEISRILGLNVKIIIKGNTVEIFDTYYTFNLRLIYKEDSLFISYIALPLDMRSQGYGKRIVDLIKRLLDKETPRLTLISKYFSRGFWIKQGFV